ncbi:MAG: beta-glucosidase BglX [Paludibacteraceae bacterium]|nr:beta-glucosidase BglX [Paludibacteraceae bacterium]
MKKHLFFLLISLLLLSCKQQKEESKMDNFIDSLMSEMTLQEKLGQLNLPVTGDIVTGQAQSSNIAEKIRNGEVGGLFNLKGVNAIREVQRIAVEESRLHIPLLFGMDVIHGYETVFPIPLAVACTWDTEAAAAMARVSAIEATADGISWTFSPMADVCCDARWGRISEGFGEDPCLTAAMTAAMVNGYQLGDLSDSTTMMACLKHFALYGAPEAGREYNTVELGRYRMFNDYFPPYRAAVEEGVGSVMASFNTLEGVPATCNKWLLTDLLREQWGFQGMVVSDYTGVYELINHGVAANLHEASQMALRAGLDMDMVAEGLPSLNDDKSLIPAINTACRRILEAKYKLGLFADPYRYCDETRAATQIYNEENRQEAREVARKSLVLLKNNNQLLPLSKQSTIALIGPLADTRANMPGTWSVAAVSSKYKTLREGLEQAVSGKGKVLYAKGCNLMYDAKMEADATMFGREMRDNRSVEVMISEAMQIARQADVIVCAMGESSEMSGECSSRTNLEMPDAQHDLLEKLLTVGKPIVLLNFSGRPVILNWENEHLDAIMQVWFAGSEAADAIADVLYGDFCPSGKLAVAFPRSVGQLPMTYRHYNTGRPLPEGKDDFSKFVSCYMDCNNSPLFPFGYGLSYTSFEYSEITVSHNELCNNGRADITVTVTNSGKRDADEVVQLYIRDLVSCPVRPVCELRDWQHIQLAAGESQTVCFVIDKDMLGFYDAQGNYSTPAGDYQIMVGPNSEQLKKATISIE